jgi:hypothetical protein
MADLFGARFRGPRPQVPDGFREWKGYRFRRPQLLRRDQLLQVAAANGRPVSPALLHKWRNWRLLPGPTPGGATGRGPGKGQTWPADSAWRVAYLCRWLNDQLTYDVLRVALWPYTPELDEDRIGQVAASLRAYLKQDSEYHNAVLGIRGDETADQILDQVPDTSRVYTEAVILGTAPTKALKRLWEQEVPGELMRPWFKDLNLLELRGFVDDLPQRDLVRFIRERRPHYATAERHDMFWDNALAFARYVVLDLFVTEKEREGVAE